MNRKITNSNGETRDFHFNVFGKQTKAKHAHQETLNTTLSMSNRKGKFTNN